MSNVMADYKYCSGCGLCESVCPNNSIEVKLIDGGLLRPIVDNSCINCAKCVRYCPGRNSEKFSYKDFDLYLYGHTNDEKLRNEAASGGVTTELLSYLIKKKYVDYIVTADENYCKGIIEGCIIENRNELVKKAGSNYCPVNMGKTLEKIRKRNGKCAIVCLPCFARGLRYLMDNDKELKCRIKYIICLLCNHVPSYNATEYLIKKNRIRRPDLVKYRGDGWFGSFRAFKLKNKDRYDNYFKQSYVEYFTSNFAKYFWQEVCINCNDHFGKYADLCVGDADFVKYRVSGKDNIGETMCFTNKQEIYEILNKMKNEGIISICDDITQDELEWIYGPLCNENRANKDSLKQNVNQILRYDRRTYVKSKAKTAKYKIIYFLSLLKHKIMK